MIQRYSLTNAKTVLSKRFKVAFAGPFKAVYNAGNSQSLPIITNTENDRITYSSWGIIPFSANDTQIGDKLINARKKTLNAKQPFCDLINSNRCIILADSFYIWKEVNNVRTPYRVVKNNEQPFAIAGLWNEWKLEDSKDNLFHSFSIITTESVEPFRSINDRMPLILPQEAEGEWLRNGKTQEEYLAILDLEDKEGLRHYPISNLIDKENNNSKKIIQEKGGVNPGMTFNLFD